MEWGWGYVWFLMNREGTGLEKLSVDFCVWETQDLCILKNPKHRYLLILFALSLVLAEESLSDCVSPAVWGSEVEQMGPQFSLPLTSVLFLPSTLFHNDQSKTFQRYVMGSESNKLGEPSAVI